MSSEPGTPLGLAFPCGLVGLPHLRAFELRPLEETALFDLASTDDPAIGFVAARADDVRPGMTAELLARGLAAPSEELLVFLSVHADAVTANLAGPVAFDPATRSGRQLVIEDAAFPLRAPVPTGAEG